MKQSNVQVVEYPYNPLFHGKEIDNMISVFDSSQRKIGFESSDGMIHFETPYYGFKNIHPWLVIKDEGDATAADVKIDDYDIVLIGSLRNDIRKTVYDILPKAHGRMVFVDGEDDPFIRDICSSAQLYFKREYISSNQFQVLRGSVLGNRSNLRSIRSNFRRLSLVNTAANLAIPNFRSQKVLPINLSINPHRYPIYEEEKKYDISFVYGQTNPYRIKFTKFLERVGNEQALKIFTRSSGSFLGALPWNEYVKVIQMSKVTVSLPGAGYDTIRYWEIPFYGSALATMRLPIQIENNFEDMISAIMFSSFREFEQKVLYALKSDKWVSIQKEGQRRFNLYHTSVERSTKFLQSIKNAREPMF